MMGYRFNLKKKNMKEKETENVCVFIENESKLQEVKELLIKYDKEIAEDGTFSIDYCTNHNFLQLFIDGKWWLGTRHTTQTSITISELEEILK